MSQHSPALLSRIYQISTHLFRQAILAMKQDKQFLSNSIDVQSFGFMPLFLLFSLEE